MDAVLKSRFKYDYPDAIGPEPPGSSDLEEEIVKRLLYEAIQVQKETFPKIFEASARACNILALGETTPEVFLRANDAIQASCLSPASLSRPVILINSGLVRRLNDDELTAVIGHEIGHFAFRHRPQLRDPEDINEAAHMKAMAASRCAEISADRAGLIACNNINAAVSALIKTSSGLGEEHIRLDLQAFLRQFKQLVADGPSINEAMSTHPFFLLRIRALVMFSKCDEFRNHQAVDNGGGLRVEDVDRSIMRDLGAISGLSLGEVNNRLISHVLILASMAVFAADGKFSREEQSFFREYFGDVDISNELELVRNKGIQGVLYELRKQLRVMGGISEEDKVQMKKFFSILYSRFSEEETEGLRAALNSLNFL